MDGTQASTCGDCGRSATKLVKGRCPRCYRRIWIQSDAGQQSRERVKAARKQPATLQRSTRVRNDDDDAACATAWYSSTTKIAIDTQRQIFAMWSAGREVLEISNALDVQYRLVQSLIDRGAISPRKVAPYRCSGCRNKTVTLPCFICESKRMHRHSRNLRDA